jgi:hypothetical protein
MTEMIWSFAPWAAFLLGTRISIWCGIGLGIAAAAVILVRAIHRHSVHMLDVVGAVFFPALAIVLAALHPSNIDTWGRYAQAGAHGTLCVLVFGSVLINRPFTMAYAKAKVAESVWRTSAFRAFNRRISAVFGFAFLVGTASLITAGSVDSRQVVLRIVVPFGALGLAMLYTQKSAAIRRPKVTALG